MRALQVMSFLVAVFVLAGCVTAVPVPNTKDPRKRIMELDNYVERLEDRKESPKRNRFIAEARLEQGLIAEKILKDTNFSIGYYKKAVAAHPKNCSAPILLASAHSKQHRVPEPLKNSIDSLYSGNCDGPAVYVYSRAKLAVLYGDRANLERAIRDLEALSTSELGTSGLTRGDVLSMIIYSHLKNLDFEGAQQRFSEQRQLQLWPVVEALMLIGNLDWESLSRFSDDQSVRGFLLEGGEGDSSASVSSIEDDLLGLVGGDLEAEVNRKIEGEASSTVSATIRIMREETAKQVQRQLDRREDVMKRIRPAVANLNSRKALLVEAKVRTSLDGGDASAQVDGYLAAVVGVTHAADDLLQQDNRIIGLGNPKDTLNDPMVIVKELEVLTAWIEAWTTFNQERALNELFERFAITKATLLSPKDIQRSSFTVELDDLGREAAAAVANVRELM